MGKNLIIKGANFKNNAVSTVLIDSYTNTELMPSIIDGYSNPNTNIPSHYTDAIQKNSSVQFFKIITTNDIPTAFDQGNYSIYLPEGLYYVITTMNEDCTIYNRNINGSTNTTSATFITDDFYTAGAEYWTLHFGLYNTSSHGSEEIPQELLDQITIDSVY